jgi:hypothetical protein
MLAAGTYFGGQSDFVTSHTPGMMISRLSPFGDAFAVWDGFRFGELVGLVAADLAGDDVDDAISSGPFSSWTLWSLAYDGTTAWGTFKIAGDLRLAAAGELGTPPAEDLLFGDFTRFVVVHGDPGNGYCTTEHETPHPVVLAAVGDHTGDGLADVAISDGIRTTIMVQIP